VALIKQAVIRPTAVIATGVNDDRSSIFAVIRFWFSKSGSKFFAGHVCRTSSALNRKLNEQSFPSSKLAPGKLVPTKNKTADKAKNYEEGD
jgi:hypothetical protein